MTALLLLAAAVIGLAISVRMLIMLCRCAEGHWFFRGGYYVPARRAVFCNRHAG